MPKFNAKQKAEGESKPNYYEGNTNRENIARDGEQTKNNDTASDTRYQPKQVVSEVNTAASAETPKTGFNVKKTTAQGSALKQEVASKVLLSDSDYAGVAGGASQSAGRSGLRTMTYSGDAGSILGNAANTPVVSSPSRSDRRFEKKLDVAMKKINFLASEQVVTEYQNPKPLSESADSVQGYYGTPKNTAIRSQKAEGGTPADMLVERSADVITEDMLFYINGQYVRSDDGDPATSFYNVEPTQITTISTNGVRTATDLTGDDAIIYGNYLPREVKVTLTRAKDSDIPYVKSIKYNVADLSITNQSKHIIDQASTAFIRDMNKDELARQAIDNAAGDETKPGWSPLGRAVLEPTQTVGFLRRVENDLGANVFTAYKFASKAHAYQLNKTAKDGQRIHTPALEMMIGNVVGQMSSNDFSSTSTYYNGFSTPFDPVIMRNGAASLAIAIMDSTAKYVTKADYLTMSKSLRSYFNIANNNMDMFRLNPEFVSALNTEDVFSTIDRGYDPLLPVCVTDKVGLITPLDWARFGDMTADSNHQLVYDHQQFVYSYANRNSNYETEVHLPLLAGLAKFFQAYAAKIYRAISDSASSTGDIVLSIPINHSTTNFSLWDFFVMGAVPFIQKDRINSLRDIIDYEEDHGYPFDLKTIKDCNPTNAVNYSFSSIDEPLVSRTMIPSAAVRWIMPEFFWGVGKFNSSILPGVGIDENVYVTPWYFNEMQFDAQDLDTYSNVTDSKYYATKGYEIAGDSAVMSMPVIRNGVRLSYLDDLYSMSEREVRLCLDRLVSLPQGSSSDDHAYIVYKYGQANEGIPAVSGDFTVLDLLKTPRELGMYMTAPHGVLRVKDNTTTVSYGFSGFRALDENYGGDTSYRLYCWKGVTSVPSEILGAASVKISRSQSFLQYWDCSPACLMSGVGNSTPIVKGYRHRLDVGFLVSVRQLFSNISATTLTPAANQGAFIPFTIGQGANEYSAQTVSVSESFQIYAMHKGLWGRLQRLPMVVSPWDTCDFTDGSGSNYDPYDFAYMFGFCGMMASDYNEDIFNRAQHVQDQGWLYTVDDFVKDSPVLKNGVQFTM